MNTTALLPLFLALTLATTAAEKKTDTGRKTTSSSVSITSTAVSTNGAPASGAVVISTDTDGKRETKVYNLGGAASGQRVMFGDKRPPAGPVTYLGVAAGEVRDDLAAHLPIEKGTGLVALTVAKDSPAAAAGLQENDVLVKFDDQILIHPQQLQVLVRNRAEGDKVKLTYLRKGQLKTATATLTKREPGPGESPAPFRFDHGRPQQFDELMKQFKSGQPPIFHRQTIVVGPDGKVQTWSNDGFDRKKIADQVIEGLKKAGVSEAVQEQVRQSIEGKAPAAKF
jgi:membrane-associated protease RseP (regulator of RpoE activity)